MMRKKEYFTSDLILSLGLYHYCSPNTKTHVSNNEYFIHDCTGVCKRIMDSIEKSCTTETELKANKEVCVHSTKIEPVCTYASYNEIIYHQNHQGKDESAKSVAL